MLERFVVTYPTPVADSDRSAPEARRHRGHRRATSRSSVPGSARSSNADRTAGAGRTDRTQYLAAKSQLALATPARDEFRSIALALPLKTSLAKKRKAMEAALGGYKAGDRLPRGRSHHGRHVRDRRDLPQARPGHHEVRAPEETRRPTSSRNTTRCSRSRRSRSKSRRSRRTRSTPSARATGVYDEGVKKSYAALAELKPGRYGKTEMMGASFDALVPPPPPVQAPDPADRDSCRSHQAPPVTARDRGAGRAPAYNIPKPPARANTEFTRALTLMRGSDPTQAILEMQVLTQSYPDLPGPYANLGVLHRNANQLRRVGSGARRRPPSARPGMRRPGPNTASRCARPASSPRRAPPTNSALKANPSYAPAHRNLGVLLDLFLDDPLTAQTELETYKTLTGEDKPVSGWLAELRARNKVRAPAPEAAPEAAAEPAADARTREPRPSRKEAPHEQTTLRRAAVVSRRRPGADAAARRDAADAMEPGVNTSAPARAPAAGAGARASRRRAPPSPPAAAPLTSLPRSRAAAARAMPRTAWTSIPRRSPATASCPRCCTSCPGAVRSWATSWAAP